MSLYILNVHTPIKELSTMKWATWMEGSRVNGEFIVGKTTLFGINISTVFLGIDHGFSGEPPVLFETMLFPLESYKDLGYQTRCSTWEQAEIMHAEAVEYVTQNFRPQSLPPQTEPSGSSI